MDQSRMRPEPLFAFGEAEYVGRPGRFEARVNSGIETKLELLEALDSGLRFPEYFGGNWDALWDCLCDLSWLTPAQVVLIHEDLPLTEDPPQLRTYLSIVNDAVAYWKDRGEHEFVVVFPAGVRALVESEINPPADR